MRMSNIFRLICMCTVIVLYALISYANAELIFNSVISFAGSFFLLCAHPSKAAVVWNTGLLEYWIAGILWLAAPLASLKYFNMLTVKSDGTSRKISTSILYMFIFIAFTAPIVTPLPPLAQGDLHTTRFLPPLSKGVLFETTRTQCTATGAGYLKNKIYFANEYLLHRSIFFSTTQKNVEHTNVMRTETFTKQSFVVFIFGTDAVGRDIFSRVVYGSRYSLGIGCLVVCISVFFGTLIGMVAGFFGGFVDKLFMRFVDVLLSIPSLFLVLTLMAIIGQSVAAMIVVLSTTGWMSIARIIRGEVLHLRHREFISASRLLGTSPLRILRIHILPNILPLIKNVSILQLGSIIQAEASLSFLGLGIVAPEPSWGNMVAESMSYASSMMWLGIFPGIALSLLVVTVHLVGEQ